MAEKNSYERLWEQLKEYLRLNVENTKLTVAEKITVAVTAAAMALIAILFGVIVLFFISVALADLLTKAVGTFWSFMIIGGAYLLLFLIIFLLRRQLIANPVSRFMTRLFFTN